MKNQCKLNYSILRLRDRVYRDTQLYEKGIINKRAVRIRYKTYIRQIWKCYKSTLNTRG